MESQRKELEICYIHKVAIVPRETEEPIPFAGMQKFIDYVSEKFNTTSNKYLFDANSIKSALVESIWFHEMPLNGPSTSLYLLLAKKIKIQIILFLAIKKLSLLIKTIKIK